MPRRAHTEPTPSKTSRRGVRCARRRPRTAHAPDGATRADTTFGAAPQPRFAPDFAARLLVVLLPLGLCGCLLARTQVVRLPERHSVETERLLILSDVRLSLQHPLVTDLQQLQQRITHELQLPDGERQVVVYLFGDEDAYRRYLRTAYPSLPPRRAYFVGTADELAVFTFWGDRIREDLRHEFTHGLLHAALRNVPLWLDEGLAEYFEVVPSDAGTPVHTEYIGELLDAVRRGWRPDLRRLEGLHDVAEMHRRDYAEAWAWVHFFLNGSDEHRAAMLDYLLELRDSAHPPAFSQRLPNDARSWNNRLLAFLVREYQRLHRERHG
ncbi:MAG: hypothetical protein D6725_04980 [Planctomycetota bacterium]|nr:MAG: hypothetical protein D6725_04980 [Planctomycetota bacterium]